MRVELEPGESIGVGFKDSDGDNYGGVWDGYRQTREV
jgi:hypothetical protein